MQLATWDLISLTTIPLADPKPSVYQSPNLTYSPHFLISRLVYMLALRYLMNQIYETRALDIPLLVGILVPLTAFSL